MRMTRFVAIIVALSLTACARTHQIPAPDNTAPPALDGATYRLVEFRGEKIPSDEKYLLSFDAQSLQARFCNRVAGEYQLAADRLTASLISTKMYCPGGHVMEMEQDFKRLLEQGARMERDSRLLRLRDASGTAVFRFQLFVD